MELIYNFRSFFSKSLLNPSVWVYWFILALVFSIIKFYIFSFILIFVLLFNFLPYFLIKNLENEIQPFDVKTFTRFFHILVLGGGHNPDSSSLLEHQLNNSSLRRVLEGVRLHRVNSNSKLIMSGESLKLGHPSQAEIQAHVAKTMGIDKDSIISISEPKNTEEEAFFYKLNYESAKTPIVLVSKALHLRRASYIFSRQGLEVYTAPAYYAHKDYRPTLLWFLFPNFQLILAFGEYLKEIVGYYFLLISIFFNSNKNNKPKEPLRRTSFEMLNR